MLITQDNSYEFGSLFDQPRTADQSAGALQRQLLLSEEAVIGGSAKIPPKP